MARHDEIEREAQPGDVERSRATPLLPAVWMTSVLAWATVIALILRAPTWGSVFLCVVTGISFFWFLVSYIYLFVSDREMLRAERFRGRKRQRSVSEPGSLESEQTLELSQDRRGYLESIHLESVAVRADEVEPHVDVVGSSRVLDK